ncbi:MAG: CYTH domain-containing protein [Proteobacteria bacterium]|nr:CYTH domain-containing protein [Pseudomonadota bacterium]
MGIEIERKFLLASEAWRDQVVSHSNIRQAYLAVTDTNTVRVRVTDTAAFLTIKSAGQAMSRDEFEYSIPLGDAKALLALRAGRLIEKRRHIVPHGSLRWEIDVFSGELAGLVIAEIELPSEDTIFERPAWLGEEITGDRRYANASLATQGLTAR